ncbi:MAG: FAD-binding oxidoreductase [Gemmatimonadetes bacterium]|nr:FAD-binding oxidoreductase [Gemmatimonadota bacterium]
MSHGFDELRARLDGGLVLPTDPGYDEAREIFNEMHDLRPGAVATVRSAQDVAHAVRFAGEHGLTLAVRGGGHSLPGFSACDDGLMIDLRGLSAVEVDPERRVAHVGGGTTWGQLNEATHAYGLSTPGGVISTTGVAGLTLGGGIGYLSREYGLACDNVVEAQVVIPDGSIVRCSEDERADLFWGIKGGGGNFGVVTEFTFRLHPVSEIQGGPTFFVPDVGVLRGFRDLLARAPREFGTLTGITRTPPLLFIAEEYHGRPTVVVITCWTGEQAGLTEILDEMKEWGTVTGQHVGPMPYPVINTLFDELLPFGLRHYWKSLVAASITDEAIETHALQAPSVPNMESGMFFHPIDGACRDVDVAASAFPHRDARCVVGVYGSWHDASDDEAYRQWVRTSHAALQTHYEPTEYVNFAPADDPDAARTIYGPNYDRLADVKATYDPGNLLRRNQNVPPAPA